MAEFPKRLKFEAGQDVAEYLRIDCTQPALDLLKQDRQSFVDCNTIGGDLSTLEREDVGTLVGYNLAIAALEGRGDE